MVRLIITICALFVTVTANAFTAGTYTVMHKGVVYSGADPVSVCNDPALIAAFAADFPAPAPYFVSAAGDAASFTCSGMFPTFSAYAQLYTVPRVGATLSYSAATASSPAASFASSAGVLGAYPVQDVIFAFGMVFCFVFGINSGMKR